MTLPTDKLLDRVRKLLALAESANVHEAAAAAGRAQALITQHKLAELLAEQEPAEPQLADGTDEPLDVGRKIRKWKLVLANGLARTNGCRAYTVVAGPRDQQLCVAGRGHDRAAIAELWTWLVKRLEWLSATHGAGHDRTWHESFRIGAADIVVERLQAAQAAERLALKTADQAALLRIDATLATRDAAIERYAEEHLKLRKGRAITVRLDALEAGRQAGRKMDLDHGFET